MELVYLWVEDYKNIKNQEFNFSPRLDCNYDGENLTITPKDYTTPRNQTIKNNLLFLKKLKFAEADYLRICA